MSTDTGSKTKNAKSQEILAILSKPDSRRIFFAARDGVKYSPAFIEELGLTRKRYYNALYELNRSGLIRRTDGGKSVHSAFGQVVYRTMIELDRYSSHIEDLKMVDALKRSGEFTHDSMTRFLEKVSGDERFAANLFSTIEIVWSYSGMLSMLLDQIENCEREVLVATRLLSEEVIRSLLAKVTQGIRVQIISDESLVESYYAMQNIWSDQAGHDAGKDERVKVVGNPWYPDSRIQRKIAKVPFGMVIIDNVKAGIEIIDRYNPDEFTCGIMIRDGKIAEIVKEQYRRMWEQASEFDGSFNQSRIRNSEA